MRLETAPTEWDQVNLVLCDAQMLIMPCLSKRTKNRSWMIFAPYLNLSHRKPKQQPNRQRHSKKTHDALGAHIDTDETIEKGHGWIEMHTLTASTALTDYLKWPGLAQVYQYRTHTHPSRKKERYDTIRYHKSNA